MKENNEFTPGFGFSVKRGTHINYNNTIEAYLGYKVTLSIEELLKVVEKLENEDLRRYGYKWTYGDEQYFNNLGLYFTVWDRVIEFEMNFELDPSKTISRKEFKNYGEDFRNKLEGLVIETIEYVNRIKNR